MTLGIGEVGARLGLSIHALRFYEREGLLVNPVARDGSGHRRYTVDDLEWLQVCISLRASGMPLSAIRRYAELVRDGPGNERGRLDLLRAHQRVIIKQIDELQHCMELIAYKVGVYEASLEDGTAETLWSPYSS